jgi:hypothetical protein
MIFDIAFAVAGVGFAIAVIKHGSVAAALASAKKEPVLIEAEAVKLEGEAKTALLAIVARLRAL